MKQERNNTENLNEYGRSKPGLQVLKVLPVILEIVQFSNLVAFGFVANQPAFYLLAVSNVKKSMKIRSSINWKKFFYRYFTRGNQAVYYVTFATGLMLVMLNK